MSVSRIIALLQVVREISIGMEVARQFQPVVQDVIQSQHRQLDAVEHLQVLAEGKPLHVVEQGAAAQVGSFFVDV